MHCIILHPHPLSTQICIPFFDQFLFIHQISKSLIVFNNSLLGNDEAQVHLKVMVLKHDEEVMKTHDDQKNTPPSLPMTIGQVLGVKILLLAKT